MKDTRIQSIVAGVVRRTRLISLLVGMAFTLTGVKWHTQERIKSIVKHVTRRKLELRSP